MISADGYMAQPMDLSGELGPLKANLIIRRAVAHDAFWSDNMPSCQCGKLCSLEAEGCKARAWAVINDLAAPDSLTWEVYKVDSDAQPVALVGILRLTQVRRGDDATAHFFFFDGKLRDKLALLEAWKQTAFASIPLHRATVEVPTYLPGLAKAAMSLGFRPEGIKREAVLYGGVRYDRLILGLLRN